MDCRTSDRDFNQRLRSAFGDDVARQCWLNGDIAIVRDVRHALSHAGGRVTKRLENKKHGIKVLNGQLHIVPEDNRRTIKTLRPGVKALVDKAVSHPSFAT